MPYPSANDQHLLRSEAEAEEVVRRISLEGGKAIPVQADVSDLQSHERLVHAALDHFGRLDILVNNAGIEFREPFLDASPASWDLTFAVNLRGADFRSQAAARAMLTFGGGKILNISSIHDDVPIRTLSIYSITKGGMKMLTKSRSEQRRKKK